MLTLALQIQFVVIMAGISTNTRLPFSRLLGLSEAIPAVSCIVWWTFQIVIQKKAVLLVMLLPGHVVLLW